MDWRSYLTKYMRENNVSLKQAMKDAKEGYHSQKGGSKKSGYVAKMIAIDEFDKSKMKTPFGGDKVGKMVLDPDVVYKIQPAPKNTSSRLTVIFKGPDKTTSLRFGSADGEAYVDHGDDKLKKAWIARHGAKSSFDDPSSRSFWSRWILWNKESIPESVEKLRKRNRDVKIILHKDLQ